MPSTEQPNGPWSEQALNTGFISTMFYIQPTQVIFITLAKYECCNLLYKVKLFFFGLMEIHWVVFQFHV